MEPRLKTSKKWTGFPKDYLKQIIDACGQNFSPQAKKGKFHADGRIYPGEILLQVGYLESGRLKQANFEASIEYETRKDDVLKLIHLAIDACASLLAEYFEEEETDFPREWKVFLIESREVYLRHTTDNTDLDAEADRLLGEEDSSLVQEEEGDS